MTSWEEADVRRAISYLMSQGYRLKDLAKIILLMREEEKRGEL